MLSKGTYLCLYFMFLHTTFFWHSGEVGEALQKRHNRGRWYHPSAETCSNILRDVHKNVNATGNFVQVMLSGRIVTASIEYSGGKSRNLA